MQDTVLIAWYEREKRLLPWREDSNPYRIWISEIMLQQTRVDQVINYFNRFMEHFPTVAYLAEASEDQVLKLWQGLGYYSRARNIHKAAKIIHLEKNNLFPSKKAELIKLPGIGEYSSGAIASIAYNERVPAVDGNVQRVLSRFYAIEKPVNTTEGARIIMDIARNILPEKDPGTFNQALMELGAMICTPTSPSCSVCPVSESCIAFRNKRTDSLPVKIKKTKTRNRYFNYLILRINAFTFIYHRSDSKDIWYHLYEFPLFETPCAATPDEVTDHIKKLFPAISENLVLRSVFPVPVHTLSHQKIHARFFVFNCDNENFNPKKWIKINPNEIYRYPTHSLTLRFTDHYNFD